MIPGEVIVKKEAIEINVGLETKQIEVTNKGDRPIQVGSHFHFFETNQFLSFDRKETYGYRLDIASGTAVRLEPNETKTVQLVKISGNGIVKGLNNLTNAQINDSTAEKSLETAKLKGFIK
jgi:urease subunit gamma/beta